MIWRMNTQNQKWAFLRKSADPYAYYNVFGDPEELRELVATKTASPALPLGISKKDFGESCRRIFFQYVPPAEGRVLRPQYRDFITRNELRSPEQRFRLLEGLRNYDIACSGNFKPHFNREPELFTTAKLQQIETLALSDRASE